MSEPKDRVGIFLVPSQFTEELQRQEIAVDALMFSEDGSVGPPIWYFARHHLFEALVGASVAHRVVSKDSESELIEFTASLDKRNRPLWDRSSPAQRRALAQKHIANLKNRLLRETLADVLAQDAGPNAGLWIATEAALPPEPDVSEPSGEVSPQELTRRLREYVEQADRAEARRERLRGPTRRAWLCELADDVARAPMTRVPTAAVAALVDEEGELTDAVEEFCVRAPVEHLAPGVYSSDQARELLGWLDKERDSATRALMLRVLRPAVRNKHAFAVVFVPVTT